MQSVSLSPSRSINFRSVFVCLAVFFCVSLQASSTYFYKNKFPGLTCVPLSFYISTFFGSQEYKGFWDSVRGDTFEQKFEGFLKASNYFRIIDSDDADDSEVHLASLFYNILHGTPQELEQAKVTPVEFTVVGGGMSIRGLYELLNTMNPNLLTKMKIEHRDYRYLSEFNKWSRPGNDEVLNLESLKLKLSESIKNGVPPVIGITKKVWGPPNIFTTNPFEYEWISQFSHALTLVHVDSEIDPQRNSFEVEYIENEDGQRKKAYFYVHNKQSPVLLPHNQSMPTQTVYFGEYETKSKKLHLYELIELMMSETK